MGSVYTFYILIFWIFPDFFFLFFFFLVETRCTGRVKLRVLVGVSFSSQVNSDWTVLFCVVLIAAAPPTTFLQYIIIIEGIYIIAYHY